MRKITLSLTRASAVAMALSVGLVASAFAQHPQAQPKPKLSDIKTIPIPGGFRVETAEGFFPPGNSVTDPPGTNFLPTVYENYRLPNGMELPNTLPSTPDGKYNLHDGPVTARNIRRESPIEDLLAQIRSIERHFADDDDESDDRNGTGSLFDSADDHGRHGHDGHDHGHRNIPYTKALQNALDILEGNPLDRKYLPHRAYQGMPLLHYNGPLKRKVVEPIFDPVTHQKIGGNVEVNMVYYGEFIESDTSMIDPSQVLDVPFTITYHVNILQNGIEDFAPFIMYFDGGKDAAGGGGVAMDQTFFPMLREGTRYTLRIKESLGEFWSLAYHWGWRIHPPRVQVIENANKVFPVNARLEPGLTTLFEMEQQVFGVNPRANEQAKVAAINMIGDLAPPKRMWNALRTLAGKHKPKRDAAKQLVAELKSAYFEWLTRRKLPTGVTVNPDTDITLFFVNNTIYGEMPQNTSGAGSNLGPASFKGSSAFNVHDWTTRPYEYSATLYNGDHFVHGYVNVDFGGQRGWENQFQFTDPTTVIDEETGEPLFPIDRGGTDEHLEADPRSPDINANPQLGSGCFFTFGRTHFWVNAGPPVGAPTFVRPVAADGTPTRMNIEVQMNFEPSMRLKVYQFDPFHHDVAVFSLH